MKLIEKATKQHYRQLNTLSKKSVINNRWDTTKKKKKRVESLFNQSTKTFVQNMALRNVYHQDYSAKL